MKIVDFIVLEEEDDELYIDATLSPDGGWFYIYVSSDYEIEGAFTWVTLTLHCEGPGASVIRFDRVETFVALETEQYILEYDEPTVNQYVPAPTSNVVGGYSIPVSRLSIVAPYIALVTLIVAITATVMIKKRNKL